MRLFLFPISTRRTFIYCQKLREVTVEQKSWLDRGTKRAANLWSDWEKKDSGWQKMVVEYGYRAMKKIPFEEWGLKSIPTLSTRRQTDKMMCERKVEVAFPQTIIPQRELENILKKLAFERQHLHKSRMIYSFIGMPISTPFMLIPIVPNIPFFYLVFRAWSHWRALSGSRHIEFLLDNKLITPKPLNILDSIYQPKDSLPKLLDTTATKIASNSQDNVEKMLLSESQSRHIARALSIPELENELNRAISQVDRSLKL
ncbi:hypothetical protein K3495_g1030 [Podosphaera aphanis]|nr:hypothetical protein K3495_g1030 [Podosphaera aphanis]